MDYPSHLLKLVAYVTNWCRPGNKNSQITIPSQTFYNESVINLGKYIHEVYVRSWKYPQYCHFKVQYLKRPVEPVLINRYKDIGLHADKQDRISIQLWVMMSQRNGQADFSFKLLNRCFASGVKNWNSIDRSIQCNSCSKKVKMDWITLSARKKNFS